MQKFSLVLCFLVSGYSIALSQTGTTRGIITDSKTGEPLIGANILVKGTSSSYIDPFP